MSRAPLLLAAALVAALIVSTTAQGLTGIDRGLREREHPPRGSASGGRFLRDSVIVRFRDGTTPAARGAMLRRVDGLTTRALPDADFDIVTLAPGSDPEGAAARLDAQPDVDYAQARYRIHPQFVPNDPLYAQQWNYPLLDMERAWDLNPGATRAITVAVIDSGVAFWSGFRSYRTIGFPDGPLFFPSLGTVDVPFAAAPDLGTDRFVAPRDFIWDTSLPVDLDGHGTHVAGTVGQLTDNGTGTAGIAFNVQIMPIKVADGFWDFVFDSPFVGTDDLAARAIRYAADNGADVINLSIGRNGGPAPVVGAAIEYAVGLGAFVVVAGGNNFEEGNDIERYAELAAGIDGAVSVGAIDRNRRRAYYSTTGDYIEIAAPGGSQRTGFGGGILQQTLDPDFVETYLDGPRRYQAPRFDIFTYEFFQGTSMAAPHVAGLAALLRQQGITSPAAIEAAIASFATDLGAPGRDDEFGYGLIDPRATLRGLGLAR
ncbi:MAG: S8 family serine peptidase [Vicinamibacterales bacterium]